MSKNGSRELAPGSGSDTRNQLSHLEDQALESIPTSVWGTSAPPASLPEGGPSRTSQVVVWRQTCVCKHPKVTESQSGVPDHPVATVTEADARDPHPKNGTGVDIWFSGKGAGRAAHNPYQITWLRGFETQLWFLI